MNLTRFIFWNVNKKDLTKYVCALARSTKPDVVVLNENTVPSSRTLDALRREVCADFFVPHCTSEDRFHCFCTRSDLDMSEIHSGSRVNVRLWRMGIDRVLLALVHGIDMRNYNRETRQSFAQSIADDVRFVSEQQNTKRVVMLGDFNMNPYDPGMNLAAGLNAMMTRACVAPGYRQHIGKKYDFYYNPMWGHFGDKGDGPAGTVYDTSNQGPYGWSMVDQVVIHHSLVPVFENVRILTEAETISLMDAKGHPDTRRASDHFPILADFRSEI
jgi:exonuclease III